jgi:adenine-specific DNA-methyltransferase
VNPLLGQVFTPAPVADLALALALEGAPDDARLLDPTCGDGVFLARARAAGVPAARLAGLDIDPALAAAAAARVPGARVEHADALRPHPATYAVVVGNPPYVRQELLGAAGKRRVAAALARDWPDLPAAIRAALVGRADLALAIVARALRLTRPGGRIALVLSAAVLDAGYRRALAGLLEGRAAVLAVVASRRERWFHDAAVHGLILVLERAGAAPPPPVRLVRLDAPVAAVARRVRGLADLDALGARRLPAGSLPDERWPALLRAPDLWFEALAAAGPALVPLAEVAEVRRGATSGCNRFFYLPRDEARGIEPRFLVPLLKSPRHSPTIHIDAARLPFLAFTCDLDEAALARHPGAAAHVRRHRTLASGSTLAGRARWWSLKAPPARVFLSKAYDERFVQHLSSRPVVADQRLYALRPRRAAPELLAAILNGSLAALAIESLGRASMGEGALELSVADAARLPVLDPARLDPAAVAAVFAPLTRRPVGAVGDEAAARDRAALDRALAAAAPGLLDLPLGAVLAAAVAERRARSR